MTQTDVIGRWAFYLAIAALILHIPLSMVAHHYLPKIENKFASYSKKRIINRVAKLRRKLERLSDPTYFENEQWNFYANSFVIMYLLGAGMFGLATVVFIALHRVTENILFCRKTIF